jgi:ribosome-binding factor A
MSFRIEKANTAIQKNLADIIASLNDPRLNGEMVSVMRVSLSPDLKYAKVFVSIFGTKDETQAFEAIKNATGYIRNQLGEKMKYRVLPELDFRLTKEEDYSENIDVLLKKIATESKNIDDKKD